MWWQERRPGGRLKSFVFLLHPGPSLLVTATFVAVAGLAMRTVPPPVVALRLAGVMLPIQFAIGVVNDVADVRSDALSKPYKPLVRGVVSVGVAGVCGVALAAAGLLFAVTFSVPTLLCAAVGLAAGLLYDVGVRATALSFVPWCVGFVALPLCAFAAANRLLPELWSLVPLAVLLALGLHCANALPDIAADRDAGRRSLPVLMGEQGSRIAMVAALLLAALLAVVLRTNRSPALLAAAALAGVATPLIAALRWRWPFPALAVVTALLAVVWLAGVGG